MTSDDRGEGRGEVLPYPYVPEVQITDQFGLAISISIVNFYIIPLEVQDDCAQLLEVNECKSTTVNS